jgi:hypothetical protein
MNCKPGDLAVVIHSGHENNRGFMCNCGLGKIVEVTKHDEFAGWNFKEPYNCISDRIIVVGAKDYCLRPLPPESDCIDHEHHQELETV